MTLCDLLGHRRVYDRHQRMRCCRDGILRLRDVYYGRCERCGVGEGDCYERGLFERLAEWWRDLRKRIEESYDPPPDDGLPF